MALVAERDAILDLNFAQGDRIDLSAIDANVNLAGDQAFTFVAGFTRVAGQATLAYAPGQNVTTLSVDVDGDGRFDFRLQINGNQTIAPPIINGGSLPTDGGWVL
jgi:serralysin